MALYDVDPMTDLGVYTYSEVFNDQLQEYEVEETEVINGEEVVRKIKKKENPFHYLKRKDEFHQKYLLKEYPPGIHKVDKKNSKIKYIDIFSNAYTQYDTDKPYKNNGRVIDDKCYYDPIVTLVDSESVYYTYNYADNLGNGATIELIIVQISHIPFEKTLLQEISDSWLSWLFPSWFGSPSRYNHGYYDYLSFYIYSENQFNTVWQIHSEPLTEITFHNIFQVQKAFKVDILNKEGKKTSFTFFSSVFYLPAYLEIDKNYKITKLEITEFEDDYRVKVKSDAKLPVFIRYIYPYPFFAKSTVTFYFFDENQVFGIDNEKTKVYQQIKMLKYFRERDRKDIKNIVTEKCNIEIEKENELEIDKQMIQDKQPFVRINTQNHFIGKNRRIYENKHIFTEEKEVGSMVIYPGYEVELRYKNIIRKTEMTNKGLVENETAETTERTSTYNGTHTSFMNAENMKGGIISIRTNIKTTN